MPAAVAPRRPAGENVPVAGQRLGALLDDARRRSFVGRRAELASIDRALTGDDPTRVLFVHGPGGIGKTTLLDQIRLRALDHGRRLLELDGREHAVTRESLAAAIAAMDHGDGDGGDRGGGTSGDPGGALVLLVDGYEMLSPLETWLRGELLPSLPADTVTVVAGREPPSAAWRCDLGWRQLMAVHELCHLDDAEGAELLAWAGVTPAMHDRLLRLGHGHPLALALLADAAVLGHVPHELGGAPEVVKALLPVFVESSPDEAHAVGLAVCAQSWNTTEALLAHVLHDDAPRVWRWLASLPFVVRGPQGLYPHDLARDVLRAEHAARGPESRLRIHRLVHSYEMGVVRRGSPIEAHTAALQLLYLHRDSPLVRGFWELRESKSVTVVPGHPGDHPGVLELVERFEGPDAAALAARWLDVQGEVLRVVRRGSELWAFALEPIVPADPALESEDQVVRALLDEMARSSPLRPGERASIGRFFGGPDSYQLDRVAAVCGSVSSLMTWQAGSLAWSWIVTVSPAAWEPVFDYLGFGHRVELPGDPDRVAFGFDWRRLGHEAWMDVMHQRELTGQSGPIPRSLLCPPPLDRANFDEAVRVALRALGRPAELAGNPLLGSGVLPGPGPGTPEALDAALRRAVELVGSEQGGDELRRVLDRTFVRAAPSQEAAAAVLDLAFSTYRRRLARALDAVTDVLWAVEIGERDLDAG